MAAKVAVARMRAWPGGVQALMSQEAQGIVQLMHVSVKFIIDNSQNLISVLDSVHKALS